MAPSQREQQNSHLLATRRGELQKALTPSLFVPCKKADWGHADSSPTHHWIGDAPTQERRKRMSAWCAPKGRCKWCPCWKKEKNEWIPLISVSQRIKLLNLMLHLWELGQLLYSMSFSDIANNKGRFHCEWPGKVTMIQLLLSLVSFLTLALPLASNMRGNDNLHMKAKIRCSGRHQCLVR